MGHPWLSGPERDLPCCRGWARLKQRKWGSRVDFGRLRQLSTTQLEIAACMVENEKMLEVGKLPKNLLLELLATV